MLSALIRLAGGRGQCGHCGAIFTRVADCKRHILRSHETGEITCRRCHATFPNAYRLKLHKKRSGHY